MIDFHRMYHSRRTFAQATRVWKIIPLLYARSPSQESFARAQTLLDQLEATLRTYAQADVTIDRAGDVAVADRAVAPPPGPRLEGRPIGLFVRVDFTTPSPHDALQVAAAARRIRAAERFRRLLLARLHVW